MVKTTPELISRLENGPDNPVAIADILPDNSHRGYSTKEMLKQIESVAYGLISLGLKKGDFIGIFAANCCNWTIVDIAAAAIGVITVPLFTSIAEDNFLFEVEQTNLKTLFVSGAGAWELLKSHVKRFKTIINIGEHGESPFLTQHLDDLIKVGRLLAEKDPDLYKKLRSEIKPTDTCTIIYTSGSTGTPKGAILAQKALTATVDVKVFEWKSQEDLYLSVLPLAHVFGRDINFIALGNGVSTYYLNDVKNFGHACRTFHPSILFVVPRLLEKVYAKMLANVHAAGFLKRKIGEWAFDLANDEEDHLYKQLLLPIANRVVFQTIREAMGGKIRVVVSGGAKLNPHLGHFFKEIGVEVFEGWGLTEGCPVTISLPPPNKIGAVGRPLNDLEVKLDEQGEILIRGDVVMDGYYKNPKATEEVMLPRGWLRTGDKGSIDEEGYLTIIGRLKELFKTSTGEYIAPVPIEQALSKAPLIDIALVVAEGRKYVTCLLFPDFEVLASLKESKGQTKLSDEEFLNSDFIRNQMDTFLESVNAHLNKWEKIVDYRFIPYHLTSEKGELTPSMKVRRDAIEKKFHDVIESMYPPDRSKPSVPHMPVSHARKA